MPSQRTVKPRRQTETLDPRDAMLRVSRESETRLSYISEIWTQKRLVARFCAGLRRQAVALPGFLPQVDHYMQGLTLSAAVRHDSEIATLANYVRGYVKTPEEAAALVMKYVLDIVQQAYSQSTPSDCQDYCRSLNISIDNALRSKFVPSSQDEAVSNMLAPQFERWLNGMTAPGSAPPVQAQETKLDTTLSGAKKLFDTALKLWPILSPYIPGPLGMVGKGAEAVRDAEEAARIVKDAYGDKQPTPAPAPAASPAGASAGPKS